MKTSLFLVMMLIMPIFVTSEQIADLSPIKQYEYNSRVSMNATQEWKSVSLFNYPMISSDRTLFILSLDDNLSSVFGEELVYQLRLKASIQSFNVSPFYSNEYMLFKGRELLISPDLQLTQEAIIYFSVDILSGNSQNASISLDIQALVFAIPENTVTSFTSMAYPFKFEGESSFLWQRLGDSFLFLPSEFDGMDDVGANITLKFKIEAFNPGENNLISVRIEEREITRKIHEDYLEISFLLLPSSLYKIELGLLGGPIQMEIASVEISLVDKPGFTLPENAPAMGVVISIFLFLLAYMIVYRTEVLALKKVSQ